MKTTVIGLLVLVGIAASGCGTAREAQQAAANAPTANVAGTWTGSSTTGGSFVPVTMTLSQTGTALTGSVDVAGRPDMTGPIKGSVQGELVQLSLDRPSSAVQLQAKQGTMTGMLFGLQVTLRRAK
jgi:uncharacterized protein YceK